MKLITLRISEEEKARLEQLAEARNVTLSRALREGAALYLGDVRERVHRARGGQTTFLGLRRDKSGRTLDAPSAPTAGERRRVESLRATLHTRGLGAIRDAWGRGEKPGVVLAAIAHWLGFVGRVYGRSASESGWDWFLRDYCPEYADEGKRAELRREARRGLVRGTNINVGPVIEALDCGFAKFLDDVERQELVRRAVLPAWTTLEKDLRP